MKNHKFEQFRLTQKAEIRNWVEQLGKYQFLVTITPNKPWVSRAELEKAVYLLLNIINRMFYGRAARRGKRSLASLAVIERNKNKDGFHAHLLLAKSPAHSISEAKEIIKRVLGSIRVFGYFDIRRYRDERHLSYVLKQGSEALFPEGCRRAK